MDMPHTCPAYVAHTEPTELAITAFLADAGRVFNVMDYGAHADGTTDDQGHIQAAIDAAHAAGGGVVYLPAATYLLYAHSEFYPGNDSNLQLKGGVTLRGAGAATILKGTHQDSSLISSYLADDIGVANLAGYSTNPGYGDVLKLCRSLGVMVSNVTAHDMYGGICLYACQSAVVKNSLSYNHAASGFEVGNWIYSADVNDAVSFSDCEAHDCTAAGFRAGGLRAGDVVGDGVPSRINNFSFTDCHGYDSTWGFAITKASNAVLIACNGASNVYAPYGLGLNNVATASLHSCVNGADSTPPVAYQITTANDNSLWAAWESTDCTGITED